MFFLRVPHRLVLCLACSWLMVSLEAQAAKTGRRSTSKAEAANQVELFEAEKAGEIEIRVIAKDSTVGNVLIKNKTGKPLSIKLPDAFVGIPVAAQFGGGGFGGGGMGGGMGGMGGGMGGMGGGGMG